MTNRLRTEIEQEEAGQIGQKSGAAQRVVTGEIQNNGADRQARKNAKGHQRRFQHRIKRMRREERP